MQSKLYLFGFLYIHRLVGALEKLKRWNEKGYTEASSNNGLVESHICICIMYSQIQNDCSMYK